jgi:two-component system sensor histidine kinase YesM
MKTLMTRMKQMKIRTKIIALYITLLVASFIIGITIIYAIFDRNTEREVGEAGLQTVNVLKGNLDLIFENITQFSNMIYFDKDIQQSLKSIEGSNISSSTLQTVQSSLSNMILSGEYISSVILIDSYDSHYKSYKVGPIAVNTEDYKNTRWFKQMQEANGDGFFVHKSENIVQYTSRPNVNYITYIREVGDMNTYDYLATLLIVIDESVIQKYFEEVSEDANSSFCIVNSEGDFIISPTQNREVLYETIQERLQGEASYEPIQFMGNDAMFIQKDLGINDWKIISVMTMNSKNIMQNTYQSTIIAFLAFNSVIIAISAIALTRLIFKPLTKIQTHMQGVERGEFVPMAIEAGYDNEIVSLKRVNNHMIHSIQKFIERIKVEEKIIAKNELDLIFAQINPHFLYNTLDAASALALIEDNKNCFKLIQALGDFYRNSLNSGKDLVTVDDEIMSVKNYMTILNIRYDNRIKMHYDIEEEMAQLKMLKLILQPVIENAVYHGIKKREGQGNIYIKGYIDEDEMIFIVNDDGAGMSENRIAEVLEGKTRVDKSGFGLYSLIQRISIYYDIESPVTVNSEIGQGTEITIRIKRIEGVERHVN